MIAAEDVAAILLAAGSSRRFGSGDKLAASLQGRPLGLHAAQSLAAIPFHSRIVVRRAGGPDHAALGFEQVVMDDPGAGQSASLAAGVARAWRDGPQAVLVALADMPFVTPAHLAALLARFGPDTVAVASGDGARRCPPALFGPALIPALLSLQGDRGAHMLLREAAIVTAPAAILADIDTVADLEAARKRIVTAE